MIPAVPPPNRRPAGRGLALLALVAAVLIGVLAMHGLGPEPTPANASARSSGHGMERVHERTVDRVAGECSHGTGGSGHAHHADATCAAAGIGASYAPPPLTSAPGLAPTAQVLHSGKAGAPESERAPPDLAELQLLRI
ncbi:DUF6153 family protein [Streptomyces kunmingensis]|uniref:DUF6153 family protein n=1 Tax=Streptomyces kunmingensis TaxID=68225 RepID=A0ABU6CLG7_9ACTN|nr:DUF6153 family protein [Streptomyces kunmingensis]MEB3965061.1 DUF6153 family protein [Streptomyces kunmingensis]